MIPLFYFFNQDLMVFIRALDGFLPLSIQRFWFPVKPYVTGLETIKLKANHPWQVNKPPRVWLVRNHLFPACTQLSNGELSKKKKQAGAELCQAQHQLELANFWFGSVASLKFDCLVQTGVVAIVSNQILSLDKCCMEKCSTDRCCMDKCCTDRCCMDTCCMDKCCMVKWYWATCQQSRMVPQT